MPTAYTQAYEYALSEEEALQLHRLGSRTAARFVPGRGGPDPALPALPEGLRAFLAGFATDPPDSGFALVTGIRIDALPPTPVVHGAGLPADHRTAGYLLLIAEALGSLFGYADEKNGALIHEVHPVRGEEFLMENTGSVDFEFHTENAHHPLSPDLLGLLCLRQDHDGMGLSQLSSVRDALPDLSAETVTVLRSERFRCRYPTSFTRGRAEEPPWSEPHAVISGVAPRVRMRFDAHNTRAVDPTGEAALRELATALDRHRRRIPLEPGHLIIIDNRIAAHGRSAFQPRYDGADRWLRRFYAMRAMPAWALDLMRRPRVLPALAELSGR